MQHVMLGKKGIKDFQERMELMGYQVTKDLLEAEELQGRGGMMDHLECLDSKVQWVKLDYQDLWVRKETKEWMQHIRHFQDQKEIREKEENQALSVYKERREVLGHLAHLV